MIEVMGDHKLDEYLNPRISVEMLDNCGIRRRLLDAVRAQAPHFSGVLLDVGCGYMPYKSIVTAPPSRVTQYIGMDLPGNKYLSNQVDVTWDGKTIPLPEESVDCAMATEFFEHCPWPESVMMEIRRVLRPGGHLFLTVPFIWPLHEAPHDQYRYTPFSLERHLRNAKFEDIEVRALGGWDASMAQMIGLWIKNRGFSERNRRIFSRLALPVIKYLIHLDQPIDNFQAPSMMPGLMATATKPLT